MKIFTVGDSHCWHAWLKIPGVVTKTCGPMTMYSFGKTRVRVVDDIPTDAVVVFCWGEIDCRCHVNKHQPWIDTIDDLVKEYLAAIAENAKTHKNIWIFNVPPPPHKEGGGENPAFPFVGSDEDRLKYVQYMNELLRKSPYVFVDVYDKYADADGFLRKDLSDGHVHIEDERYLKEWIDERISRPQ